MREYEESRSAKRQILADEKAVYNFQRKVADDGYDPLTDWQRLREEGKIQIGKDLPRDKGTSRLGSEGLVEVRVDERMPYIGKLLYLISPYIYNFSPPTWALSNSLIAVYINVSNTYIDQGYVDPDSDIMGKFKGLFGGGGGKKKEAGKKDWERIYTGNLVYI